MIFGQTSRSIPRIFRSKGNTVVARVREEVGGSQCQTPTGKPSPRSRGPATPHSSALPRTSRTNQRGDSLTTSPGGKAKEIWGMCRKPRYILLIAAAVVLGFGTVVQAQTDVDTLFELEGNFADDTP